MSTVQPLEHFIMQYYSVLGVLPPTSPQDLDSSTEMNQKLWKPLNTLVRQFKLELIRASGANLAPSELFLLAKPSEP